MYASVTLGPGIIVVSSSGRPKTCRFCGGGGRFRTRNAGKNVRGRGGGRAGDFWKKKKRNMFISITFQVFTFFTRIYISNLFINLEGNSEITSGNLFLNIFFQYMRWLLRNNNSMMFLQPIRFHGFVDFSTRKKKKINIFNRLRIKLHC